MPSLLTAGVKSAQVLAIRCSKGQMKEREPVFSGHTIPAHRAWLLTKLWERRRYNTDRLFRRCGVSRDLLASRNGRLTQAQFSSIFRSAAILRNDDSWGLCPEAIPLGTFAAICRAAVGRRTLGQVLNTGLAQYRVATKSFTGRLHIDSESNARLSLRDKFDDTDASRQIHHTFIFFVYKLMCWVADRRIPLKAVYFAFSASEAGEELARAYHAPLIYDSEITELVFDARWLRLANAQDLQSVNDLLRHSPGNLAVAFSNTNDTVERVRRYLRKNVAKQLGLNDAAAELRMSVATLRRRLSDAGVSFQKMKDDVRRDVSINLLVDSNVRLEELASRVGFLEVSAFHRAFRRWTGCAPSDYRLPSKK